MGPWEPTGNAVDARVMIFFRLADGRIIEVQAVMDSASFARQLGGQPVGASTTTWGTAGDLPQHGAKVG
jgi:hypothetical protein